MNNNNRHGWDDGADIPNWIIVLSMVFAFPLGVVLLLVKLFAGPLGSDLARDLKDAVSDGTAELEKLKKEKKKSKKFWPSFGEILSGGVGIFTFILTFGSALSITEGIRNVIGFFICAVLTAFFAGIVIRGHFARERYSLYRSLIGDKTHMKLSAISSMAGVPQKKVMRDIRKMIDKGYLGDEAVIDVGNDALFMTREAADEYRKSYSAKDAERTRTVEDEKPFRDRVQQDEYRRIILEIRRLNDEIADIAVSERIYRIEEHTQHIFDYVKEHPEKKHNIRTFMNYYLPTTLKLLEAYAEIEKVGVAGENMRKSKESIERTLDLISEGFENQLDMLYEMKNIDISSDIDVLETMMKKDGMIGSFGGAAALEKDDLSDEGEEKQ